MPRSGGQDAGLWPVETEQKDRALSKAGAQKAKAMAHYLQAARTLDEQGTEEALPVFKEVLALDPASSVLMSRVASLAAAAGQPQEAKRLLEAAVKGHPKEEGPLLALMRLLVDQKHAEAMATLKQARTKFPGSPELCRLAVRVYVNGQQRSEAQAAVRQTLARDSRDPQFWLAMAPVAREAFPLDDPDTRAANVAIVTGCIEKAAALGGDDPAVLEAAADFYARLQAPDKAAEYYRKLAALQPGNLTARRKLGQCSRLTGDLEGARRIFAELLRIDSADTVSHRALTSMLEEAGEAKEALKHRMELLRIDGGTAEEYLKLAARVQEEGMADENRLTLERGAFANPRSARLVIALAAALYRAGRVPEASAQYEKAVELAEHSDPDALDDAFHLGRAQCVRDAGDRTAAAGHFRKAIDKVPKGKPERAVPAYCGLAMLWLEDGTRLEEARELLRLASALKKDDPAVNEALGFYAARKGDWEAALKEYQQAEKGQVSPSPAFVLRLTDALERLKRKEEAIACLEKATALPNAAPVLKARLDVLRGAAQKVQKESP
ncbi:MAG TPA: tetratricopeptide repeat protein [Verrucomicrobiales bacterium]|nr:tetratricopeptide repeat protein [Verrucomicrobiales bacterium]